MPWSDRSRGTWGTSWRTIAEDHQRVRGVIIALDDDKRIRRALQIAQGIDFYRYEVKFNLIPAS